jgi:uncharacterized membrane protein HdeD (DUF308 family)
MVTDPVMSLVGDATRYWWLHLVRGIAALIFAIIAVAYPGITIVFLAILVAVWAFVIAFSEIAQAMRLRAARKSLRL